MKILMINKFLHPNGGSETYIFKLGEYLQSQGHQVQYFGMEHEGRCVGNEVGAYTCDMDFHGGSFLAKLSYPIKTIYSAEARRKLRLVLDDFQPDVCHLNNFNYQLTPSIILEIRNFEKDTGMRVKIVYTAHDSQLVCPNHTLQNPITGKGCTKCLGGKFLNCTLGKCIHGSLARSVVASAEAFYWNGKNVYNDIDTFICPSNFINKILCTNPSFADKTVVLRNFVEKFEDNNREKKDYVLYFGRYSKEKGIETLLKAVDGLKDINFVFAGSGPLRSEIEKRNNIQNKGFLSGTELGALIAEARFSLVPSECYENCPFSAMESQMYGTPVLGADIGGIPELIQDGKTGELFESGNVEELSGKIRRLWENRELTDEYSRNCKDVCFDTVEEYCKKLMPIYEGRCCVE